MPQKLTVQSSARNEIVPCRRQATLDVILVRVVLVEREKGFIWISIPPMISRQTVVEPGTP